MHIISSSTLKQFWRIHPEAESSLRYWIKLTEEHCWQTPSDVRQTFPSADFVKRFTVFNIGGNKYRLIALINFSKGRVYIRAVLTHAEYDKNNWKKDPWFEK